MHRFIPQDKELQLEVCQKEAFFASFGKVKVPII
ncbi:hypothetical protein A33I_06375 [Alkalihalophilus marmarensis DSM 21297]|jgi:hypothetical protein|uniref:Uncharacterized protein n=1 Tax=Alkalihalophilus marmarensis DSM 21297 TaxID=1188261 RepID=U6SV47_9BACI|nr:hypothetical protein A33I_06375 [Alkalihalophilus marmarensis DSM 21297]